MYLTVQLDAARMSCTHTMSVIVDNRCRDTSFKIRVCLWTKVKHQKLSWNKSMNYIMYFIELLQVLAAMHSCEVTRALFKLLVAIV